MIGERHRLVIAMFHVEQSRPHSVVEIDRPPREPRRRAGLQSAPREAKRLERFREIARRRLARSTGRPLLAPDVNQPVEERPGRDHQRIAARTQDRLRAPARQPRPPRPEPGRPARASTRYSACASSVARTHSPYRRLSACARGDQTAGPRLRLSSLNCMPVASMAWPISPPSASISLTR